MARLNERTYYRHIVKILRGNENTYSGVYDSEEQLKESALRLTKQLWGSTAKARESGVITGTFGATVPPKGMSVAVMKNLEAFLKELSIDQQDKVKEYIDHIIAQKKQKGILLSIKRIISIKDGKLAGSEFIDIANSVEITQSTIEKIKGIWKYSADNDKYVDFGQVIRTAASIFDTTAVVGILEATGIYRRTPGISMTHACVLGLLPLQHIREIEVARSGKVLKFRATGSVFLAKQEGGGDDAIRIAGKFYRDEIVILIALWKLYQYGAAGIDEEFALNNAQPYNLADIRKRASNIVKFNVEKSKPTAEVHSTFPFVSRHVIIPNVYIETLSFEEKIEDGINVIRYDILLRTFNKKKAFKTWNTDNPDIKYAITQYDENLTFHKMFELSINWIWRTIQAEKFIINTGSWKVGVTSAVSSAGFANTKARDVYYNIQPIDVVSTFAMGALGFRGMKLFGTGLVSGLV